MRLVLLLLLSFNLFAADGPERTSPFNDSSDESDLCDMAMSMFRGPQESDLDRHIRPYLMEAICQTSNNTQRGISAAALPASDAGVMDEKRMHEMIVLAIKQSFEEKEALIARQESRIKEKYSGKKVATIAAIFSLISAVVSSVCSTIVSLKSK